MTEDRVTPFLSASTWSGALISGVGAVTLTQWLAVGGFILAFAGFCVNVWHKRAMVKIERERLEIDRATR